MLLFINKDSKAGESPKWREYRWLVNEIPMQKHSEIKDGVSSNGPGDTRLHIRLKLQGTCDWKIVYFKI